MFPFIYSSVNPRERRNKAFHICSKLLTEDLFVNFSGVISFDWVLATTEPNSAVSCLYRESDSAVSCLSESLNLQCPAYRRVWLCSVLHTGESDSVVSYYTLWSQSRQISVFFFWLLEHGCDFTVHKLTKYRVKAAFYVTLALKRKFLSTGIVQLTIISSENVIYSTSI